MIKLSPADRVELQDVMLNYAAAVDERDRQRYSACFAADVEVFNFGDTVYRTREAWVDYVWNALNQYSATQHLLGPQLVTAVHRGASPDVELANTRSDVQALHVLADGTSRFTLWATYLTDMACIEGQWLIVRHELRVKASASAP